MNSLKPIVTGTKHTFTFIYKDASEATVDVTGYTGEMVIRRSLNSDPLLTINADVGTTDGVIAFELNEVNSAALLDENLNTEKMLIGANITVPSEGTINLFQTTIDVNRNIVS